MKNDIYKWLANQFSTLETTPSIDRVKEALCNEKATTFLLVWPVFEQTMFSGYLRHNRNTNDLATCAQKYSSYFSSFDAEDMAEHFHKRYQCKQRYKNLRHTEDDPQIKAILDKTYDQVSDEEKLHLILYVVYRFRNNIFHGNKGIMSWSQYSQQIEFCVRFMMRLVDEKERHSDEVSGM